MTTAATFPEEFVESCSPDGCANCSRLGSYCAIRGHAITCLELVGRDGFDSADRPVAGTECVGCRHLGHYCPAKGMCGELPLCLACGTGEICDQARSVERMRTGGEDFELEHGYSAGECRTIEITDADRVVNEVAPVSDWAIKASLDPENLKRVAKRKVVKAKVVKERKPRRIAAVKSKKPKEVVMAEKMELEAAKAKAIEMYKGGAKIGAIFAETGYSWAGVQYWLRQAGLLPDAKAKAGAKKKKAAEPKPAPTLPAVKPTTIAVQVTERDLDTFWSHCTLAEKACAFSAVLEGR